MIPVFRQVFDYTWFFLCEARRVQICSPCKLAGSQVDQNCSWPAHLAKDNGVAATVHIYRNRRQIKNIFRDMHNQIRKKQFFPTLYISMMHMYCLLLYVSKLYNLEIGHIVQSRCS